MEYSIPRVQTCVFPKFYRVIYVELNLKFNHFNQKIKVPSKHSKTFLPFDFKIILKWFLFFSFLNPCREFKPCGACTWGGILLQPYTKKTWLIMGYWIIIMFQKLPKIQFFEIIKIIFFMDSFASKCFHSNLHFDSLLKLFL